MNALLVALLHWLKSVVVTAVSCPKIQIVTLAITVPRVGDGEDVWAALVGSVL